MVKASHSGRGFNRVTHPAPEAAVIDVPGHWPIAVEVGPEMP